MSAQPAILHVDMDAFFASVEIRDRPELRGLPVLVGGGGRRGVVAAASYAARRFGCRSAQPMAHALRLCPHAVVVAPRHAAYSEVSRQVFAIFERFTPLVEGLSIDEAFLDLAGTERLWGPPRAAAEAIRAAVVGETGLTCSVGISRVKFIAKIASGMNKPDGLTEIPAGSEAEFLATLPIGALWGVGPRTQEKLERRGVHTVGDLRGLGEAELTRSFGAHGLHLHRLSHAIDERAVIPDRAAKSIGSEDTYAVDILGVPELRRRLLAQATRVADRLVAEGLRARCVHIKIRDGHFITESRQCTLPRPTDSFRELHEAACRRRWSTAACSRHHSNASARTKAMIQKRTTTCGSDQPFFSKWWWIGAIRKMRRPVSLYEPTCSITDTVSITNTPLMMKNTISWRTIAWAIAPQRPNLLQAAASAILTMEDDDERTSARRAFTPSAALRWLPGRERSGEPASQVHLPPHRHALRRQGRAASQLRDPAQGGPAGRAAPGRS